MSSLKELKDTLRAKYKLERAQTDGALREQRDAQICRRACELVSFRHAEYVLLYASLEDEICIDALAKIALERGKKTAFPLCDPQSHTMSYRFVNSVEELISGSYGIREPSPDAPAYDGELHRGSAVCFVPGVVFDKAGYRVGYGKGYYDRFLSSFSGSRIGVVYSDFILPSLPRGRFDEKVDMLLSEKGVKITSES